MADSDTTAWITRTRARKDIPFHLKNIMVDMIIRNRQVLEQVLGNMELIYLREKKGRKKNG
ncbi:hypothetical protein LCGC14_2929310 [marine sediment metagenome]|uniref:Uncharacterized protein n=1 Tax=marine sediment metagenome TaxID=412755 RepID=A0A0F9ACJ8_9ZZZZ